MLSSALERRYQMALQDFQRWLTANVEKTTSCNPDFAGDRYSLESKLGILQVILYFCFFTVCHQNYKLDDDCIF